jgi:hypothetical protein
MVLPPDDTVPYPTRPEPNNKQLVSSDGQQKHINRLRGQKAEIFNVSAGSVYGAVDTLHTHTHTHTQTRAHGKVKYSELNVSTQCLRCRFTLAPWRRDGPILCPASSDDSWPRQLTSLLCSPELLQFFSRAKHAFSMFGSQNVKEAFSMESSKEFDNTKHAEALRTHNSHW